MALPLASQILPSSALSLSYKLQVDLRRVLPGRVLTVNWCGALVFVRNRTLIEVRAVRRIKLSGLRDKLARNENIDELALASDVNRCADKQSQNWLVLLAPCTHLGCIPEARSYG